MADIDRVMFKFDALACQVLTMIKQYANMLSYTFSTVEDPWLADTKLDVVCANLTLRLQDSRASPLQVQRIRQVAWTMLQQLISARALELAGTSWSKPAPVPATVGLGALLGPMFGAPVVDRREVTETPSLFGGPGLFSRAKRRSRSPTAAS